MISSLYKDFLFRNLDNPEKGKGVYRLLDFIFSSTSNIPIVSNIALASSFCHRYSILQQKYGAIPPRNIKTIEIGNKVHELLSLASIRLFETSRSVIDKNLISDSIKKAEEELEKIHRDAGDKNFTVDKEIENIAKKLLERMVNVLRELKSKGKISDYNFFPIVEQTFHDFDYKLYGIPDLILEREDKEFAIVIDWKIHSVDDRGYPDETDKAQVIAYSILEARRLGIYDYDKIFEAISGLTIDEVESLNENENKYEILLRISLGRVKVLPVVVGKNGGFPPHPYFYERAKKKHDIINRFKRMLKLYNGVIVGADYLTLQLINISKLLNYSLDEINEIFKSKNDKPVYWLIPDGLRKGFCPNCPLREPCRYYFSRNNGNKSNLDNLERAERSEILEKREKSLLYHKAIDMVLDRDEIEKLRNDPEKHYLYKVKLDKNEVEWKMGEDPINIIKVYRRGKMIHAFKFDIFNSVHVNNSIHVNPPAKKQPANIILCRKLRNEEKSGKWGLLRPPSVTVSLIDMSKKNLIPTLSINALIKISDYRVDENNLCIVGYVNPGHYAALERFKYYVKYYKEKDTVILVYESEYDLSSLENRGVYTTYGSLKKVGSNGNSQGTVLENLKKYLGG